MMMCSCLIFALALSGCGPKKTVDVPTSGVDNGEQVVQPIEETESLSDNLYLAELGQYKVLMPQVDKNESQLISEEAQKKTINEMKTLVDKNADTSKIVAAFKKGVVTLSPENATLFADLALSSLQKNVNEASRVLDPYAEDQAFGTAFYKEGERVGGQYGQFTLQPEKIQFETLKKLVLEAKERGYVLSTSEGMFYYLVDYTLFAQYQEFYTKEFAVLIESLAIDSIDPLTSDAAIKVSDRNLAGRTMALEDGLKEKVNSPYQQYIVERYLEHMTMILFGSNNTPSYDYETNRITEERVDFYKEITKSKSSRTSQLLEAYMKLLEGNKGILSDSVRQSSEALLTEIRNEFNAKAQNAEHYYNWLGGQR